MTPEAGRLGRLFSGCKRSAGVRGCARLRLADRCSRFAATSVLFEGISQILRKEFCFEALGNFHLQALQSVKRVWSRREHEEGTAVFFFFSL